jgi:urease accessory protein
MSAVSVVPQRSTISQAPRAKKISNADRHDQRLALHIVFAALAMMAVLPSPAMAHDGTGLAGGFISGFLHPLTGPDHMLAMVSVGLWGAFLGRPLVYVLPMVFPALMVVGGAVGMAGIGLPPVELGIAVSVLTLGLMILFAVRAPVPVAVAIVAVFALFHGYAHGAELPSAADPVGYSAGFVLCTGLLHVVGIALGAVRGLAGGTMVLRAAGGLIALTGVWFLIAAVSA